eukprot:scaffold6088_cov140-Skeletonema_dohrnii-CCMP3373.AAC.1
MTIVAARYVELYSGLLFVSRLGLDICKGLGSWVLGYGFGLLGLVRANGPACRGPLAHIGFHD